MIKCDYDCENCNRYTTVHYNGMEWHEYDCIVAGKRVTKYFDENGNVDKIEVG